MVMPRAPVSNGMLVLQKSIMADNRNDLGVLILAGGQSQRMGMDKALLPFAGRTFIECIVDQCASLSNHLVISIGLGQQDSLKERFESSAQFGRVTWVEDEHPNQGPLAGIAAGLKSLETYCRYAFVTGCDVPVVKSGLAKELFRIAQQHDCRAATPVDGERIFGMTAVYRTDSWRVGNDLIRQGRLRVSSLAEQLDARKIDVADLREFDPKLESFLNINHPEAYRDFLNSQGVVADPEVMKKLKPS